MSRYRLPLALAALVTSFSGPVFSAPQLHRLDIRVTSAVDGKPAVGGTIKATGPQIERVEYPDSVVARGQLKTWGTDFGEGGRTVLLVGEGTYTITLTMAGHEPQALEVTVPWSDEDPAPGEIPTRQLSVEMPVSSKQLPRVVVVTVLEEFRTADGRRERRPLADAQVGLEDTDTGEVVRYRYPTRQVGGYRTGEDGVAVLYSEAGLAIGDFVRVVAWKNGYESDETTLTIGSGGPNTATLGMTSLSAGDAASLVLRKRKEEPQDAKLIVRVVDANTNEPLADAQVYAKAIGGQSSGPYLTNAEGLSPTFTLLPSTAEEVHALYRLSVRKEGYAEKWEDLPNEYVEPALEPRTYPVQLAPVGAEHWTAAEQQAFARYRAWALGKDATEDPPMFGTAPTGRFTWTEPYRTPDGKLIRITFRTRCSHLPNHPAGPRPRPNLDAIRDRDDLAAVVVAGYLGIGSTGAYHGAWFEWQQGWFDVRLSVNSPWITHPELGEVRRWAEQLAGVIGDPGE